MTGPEERSTTPLVGARSRVRPRVFLGLAGFREEGPFGFVNVMARRTTVEGEVRAPCPGRP